MSSIITTNLQKWFSFIQHHLQRLQEELDLFKILHITLQPYANKKNLSPICTWYTKNFRKYIIKKKEKLKYHTDKHV